MHEIVQTTVINKCNKLKLMAQIVFGKMVPKFWYVLPTEMKKITKSTCLQNGVQRLMGWDPCLSTSCRRFFVDGMQCEHVTELSVCRAWPDGEDQLPWDCCAWRTPRPASCRTAGALFLSHPPSSQVDAARSLAAHSATYSPLTAVSISSFEHRLFTQ